MTNYTPAEVFDRLLDLYENEWKPEVMGNLGKTEDTWDDTKMWGIFLRLQSTH